jgi:hypothetical protein
MRTSYCCVAAVAFGLHISLLAQTGPFDPEAWPPTIDTTQLVDYVVTDAGLEAPDPNWFKDGLIILAGGDQVTQNVVIGGHTGKKVVGNFLNVADRFFEEWADDEFIDVLVQVYGNEALLSTQGEARDYTFLTGVLPNLNWPVGGQIPPEANNKKWNWVLFRVANELRPSGDSRYVGSVPAGSQGNTIYGGVNGGTIRFEGVPGLIVRCVAFGEQGAFGEPEQINQFTTAEQCAPEPLTNLAGIDIAAQTADHMVVIDTGDQTVSYLDGVGPAGDQRRAVVANNASNFLNFGITDDYLGKACNDPRTVKVCVDFYDDPAFAGLGVSFGPEAFATDDLGGTDVVAAERRQVLQGTGQWIRRSWVIADVSLKGVNAGIYTAGPRLISANAPVAVSRMELAVLRTGDHPLAGLDPLEDCYADPAICEEVYGSFAELDLAMGLRAGLDVGTSSGDQEMIQEEAGPAGDRRMAVRPARDDGTPGFTHQYLNFAILEEALGPSSQPPAHLAICVTYYDDPALVGARFKPEVYRTELGGMDSLGFTPDSAWITVTGSDAWRTAYWEIENIKFLGVNQAPQAAARFSLSDKIFFTSVRYAVIRPCGPQAGVNLLEACKPVDIQLEFAFDPVAGLRLSWPIGSGGGVVQETADLATGEWSAVVDVPQESDGFYILELSPGAESRFYRLVQ